MPYMNAAGGLGLPQLIGHKCHLPEFSFHTQQCWDADFGTGHDERMSLFMLSYGLEAKMVRSSFFNPFLHQLTYPAALVCLQRLRHRFDYPMGSNSKVSDKVCTMLTSPLTFCNYRMNTTGKSKWFQKAKLFSAYLFSPQNLKHTTKIE